MEYYIHSPNYTMGIKNLELKNKKGEFLASDFILVLVLFGAVVLLAYLFIGDMASSDRGYDVPNMTDENFEDRYDTLTESSTTIYEMQNATSSEQGMTTISTFTTIFTATFSIISLVFGSIGMVNTTFSNFATDFGVPSAVANIIFPAILVIIIVIIVFVVISSVSRGRL